MYGPGVHARQLLATRRLLERGVRFVQLWHGEGQPWDHHDDLATGHRELANQCDRPIAAFLKDLKQRGMLDDTLVIWGGEFGRTPTVELPTPGSNQGKMNGRDHNHYGFTMWMAGGGVKGGYVHGATDDLGFQAVENKVHVHDLHATLALPPGLRPRTLHLSLRRPRLPPDRRPRTRHQGHYCVNRSVGARAMPTESSVDPGYQAVGAAASGSYDECGLANVLAGVRRTVFRTGAARVRFEVDTAPGRPILVMLHAGKRRW